MEALTNLRDTLGKVVNYDDFLTARRRLDDVPPDRLFEALWALAIQRDEGLAAVIAGFMLVERQPDTDRTLASLLTQIHASQLDASNKTVPFYLIAQFGKAAVLRASKDFLASVPPEQELSRVDSVRYWAHSPAASLCFGFHDWVCRFFYEIPDEETVPLPP